MEKVYSVEFIEYTNCMYDTVSNNEEDFKKVKYLHVGKEPFLVKESDLDKYKEFGKGFRNIAFVGYMEV